jgi:hypothetical protein
MTDSLWQRVGGTRLPLDVSQVTAAASFEVADPALDVLLGLFSAALRNEFGTGEGSAWHAITSALPPSHRLFQSTDPIGTAWKIGADGPSATLLRQVKVGSWPMLGVWRDGPGEYEQRTTTKEFVRQRWGVMWALSDYEADLTLKLGPALTMAGRIICQAAIAGSHPGYLSGAKLTGSETAWLSRLAPISSEAGGNPDRARARWAPWYAQFPDYTGNGRVLDRIGLPSDPVAAAAWMTGA